MLLHAKMYCSKHYPFENYTRKIPENDMLVLAEYEE